MPAVAPNVLRARVGGAWRPWATPYVRWGQPSNLRGTITTPPEALRPGLPGDDAPHERILRLLRDFVPTGLTFAELSYVGSPSAAVDGDRWYIEALGLTVERDSGSTADWYTLGPYRYPIPTGWKLARNQAPNWVIPKYVWAFSAGSWRVVWAKAPSAALAATASLQGDGTVDITWDSDDPEVASRYDVRRSNNTLVASVTATGASSYLVTDSTPLPGNNTYSITPVLGTLSGTPAVTNPVDVDLTPDTATVTFDSDPAPNRSAIISWTGEKPGTQSVTVRRPNGTLVGTVAPGVLTINDNSPSANVDDGRYEVTVTGLGGSVGGVIETNAVDIALTPTVPTLTLLDADTRDVTMTWDAGAVGEHTGFRVSSSGATIASPLPEGVGSYSETAPPGEAGKTYPYSVASLINGNVSPALALGSVDFNPLPPVSVSAAPTSNVGELRITYANGDGVRDFYEVEVSNNGSSWSPGFAPAFSGATWDFGSSGSGPRYFRIRAVATHGGVSPWVVVSATPVWDTTPPALPTITSWKPESSYGRLVVRFQVSNESQQYEVSTQTNSGSWVVRRSWTAASANQSIAFAAITGTEGNTYRVRIRVRDSLGNTSGYTSSWFYTLKPQIQDILPVSSGHWRTGTYGQDTGNPTRVYQWYFSNPAFEYVGLVYYGTAWRNACNAAGTVGGKITVTGMRCVFIRPNAGGNAAAQAINVGVHTLQSNPGFVNGSRPIVSHRSNIVSLAWGGIGEPWLTAAQRNALRDGTHFGLAIENPPYLYLWGFDQAVFQFFGKIYSLG